MLAVMSPDSLQRATAVADWAEGNLSHRPFWLHPEYLARFAGSTDAELRAAASIIEARNAEREREIAGLQLLTAAMRVARFGAAS